MRPRRLVSTAWLPVTQRRATHRRARARGWMLLSAALLIDGCWQAWWGSDQASRAYIGPGAGIALVGSFLAVFAAIAASLVAIVTWPLRRLWRAVRGQKAYADARVKRVVVIGLDGLEPSLVQAMMTEGLLPHLAGLRQRGAYRELGTTTPPLSPVAWSSFATGTNPGKHNIFDFLRPGPAGYRPVISSVRIEPPRRSLRLGRIVVPLSRPRLSGLRRSKPFWSVLGEAGVFSAVLRVPITFPPDRFYGVQLSAMCVPDLLGSQGTFFHFVESGPTGQTTDGDVGGWRVRVARSGRTVRGAMPGPPDPLRRDQRPLSLPFTVKLRDERSAVLVANGRRTPLRVGVYSDWIRLTFRTAGGIGIHGVCRVLLQRPGPPFAMYCTPIQIDPDRPVMPISHPRVYATYLARRQGTYATLGLAEDTWSLAEGVLDEDAFLEQVGAIHDERQSMLLDALRRVRRGTITCVFDAPDRVQHMFWRFVEPDHPALAGRPATHRHVIRDMYTRMDRLVGRVLEKIDDDTVLFVMSDHGFGAFRREVDLNAWLLAHGYLALNDGGTHTDRPYLADVDWARTRAFAIGLAGIYVNQAGRQAHGIVPAGAATRELVARLKRELDGLVDTACEHEPIAIRETMPAEAAYTGPYVGQAPDLIVGYNRGYRVAWNAATGKCGEHVFADNCKAWSGDHGFHPSLVPGVLFSSIPLHDGDARIIDLAPTILDLMGVDAPPYMDGVSLLRGESS